MIPTLQINQIKETCLYVHDLAKTKAFYHDKLQLPIIGFVENSHIFFRAGSSVLLCFIAENSKHKKQLPPHYGVGHLHFAFEVSDEQYAIWKSHLPTIGIPIIQEVSWKNNTKSFYFKDPDNHVGEIVMVGMWD